MKLMEAVTLSGDGMIRNVTKELPSSYWGFIRFNLFSCYVYIYKYMSVFSICL